MMVRLYQKGSEPPPSNRGAVNDIETEHLPAVGDIIQLEGKNAEVVKRWRVASRLFRSALASDSTEVALEVEAVD